MNQSTRQRQGRRRVGLSLGHNWDYTTKPLPFPPSPPDSPTTVGYLTTPPAALASAPTSVLSQPGALVRMQGVPYTAGMKDLLSIFQAYQVRCGWSAGEAG